MTAPAFSVIVPVHNVRAYLRECLDSILNQSVGDLELIAVDDASPDGSGEILDEYAAADPRVQVVHLQKNVGLGPARNVGLRQASGRYVVFVDSDDSLTDGALAAIERRLAATGSPDILVFDYARTFWWNSAARNQLAEVLTQRGPDVFTVADRPQLLELLMVVWNKAYRREWLETSGLSFPPGYYEDVPFTYPAMIRAERIAVLDRVCYHYRQRRHGNILRSSSRKHFDIFDQYDRVFAQVDAHPEMEPWRTFLFGRMVTHLMMIIRVPGRVDASLRKEWFERCVQAYQRYLPAGYQPPGGPTGVKVRTVAARSWPAFEAVHRGGTAVRRAKSELSKAQAKSHKNVLKFKRALIQLYYHAHLTQPIDENLAVYAAYWSRSYSCNPAAIYEEARRIAPHVRGVWVIRPDSVAAMPKGVEYVELGSPEYYRTMARAKYLVNNVNFADNIKKRRGTVHIQTNHGTPLKNMGLQLQNYPIGAANLSFRKLMVRCDKWDYLISSNRYSSEVWERAYPADYVTLETGYPRNDKLVRATADDQAALRAKLDLPADKTVILYAPTFRDWARNRFVASFALDEFCRRLGDQYVVLVRGHYFTKSDDELAALQRRGLLRDVSTYPVLEELMIASDALVTDYSSIMFDYANLDRPIVIHAEDWEIYKLVRGANFELPAAPPGVVAFDFEQLVDAFTSGRYVGAEADAHRKEFRKRFCMFDDGHAAERIVRQLYLGQASVSAEHSTHGTGTSDSDSLDDDGVDADTG